VEIVSNIGIVTTWFERGAAYVSRAFRDALSKQHNVFIYARGGEIANKDDPRWSGPQVYWAQRLHATSIDWNEFHKWVKDNKIDVVIFNEQQDHAPIVECKKFGIKTIAYIDFYRKGLINHFKDYTGLVCCTQRHYSVFKDFKMCRFVQWGTDVDLFKPKPKPEHHDKIVFYHSAGLGGVLFRKGTPTLVDAFKQIRDPSALLIISSQRDLRGYPPEMISEVNINPRIYFRGETAPHPGNYHLGDVYVYPSKLEGIGLSVPEAMAVGLPVITTNNGPMNEFVSHNGTGKLINIHKFQSRVDSYYWDESLPSVDHLASLMNEYVLDRSSVRIHGIAARRTVEAKFNWDKNKAGLLKIVEDVLKI